MPGFGTIWKLVQYIPVLLEIRKAVMPGKEAEEHTDHATQSELADFKRDTQERVQELESEQTRLRTRLRELETTLNWMQTLLYIGLGTSGIIFILFLVAIVIMRR